MKTKRILLAVLALLVVAGVAIYLASPQSFQGMLMFRQAPVIELGIPPLISEEGEPTPEPEEEGESTPEPEEEPPPPPPLPPDEINIAEYASMLVNALNNVDTSAYNDSCAADVLPNAWYTRPVCYLVNENIIALNPDGEVGINNFITRASASEWLYQAFEVQQIWPFPGSFFQDSSGSDDQNVLGAYEIFMIGAGDLFRPGQYLLEYEADYWTGQAETILSTL